MSYLDDAVEKLVGFEARVPWMYLDSRGLVTVDVGVMLPNVDAALALPFRRNSRAARMDEIARDYVRVKGMTANRLPGHYLSETSPRIDAATGDRLLRERLAGIDAELRERLTGYAAAPAAAKLALLDMRYNLGMTGLLEGFPRLCADVAAGSWATAALACRREGPGDARNDWTREQFELAAKTQEAEKLAAAA